MRDLYNFLKSKHTDVCSVLHRVKKALGAHKYSRPSLNFAIEKQHILLGTVLLGFQLNKKA